MVSAEEQKTINRLQANWVWVPDWNDSSTTNTIGRIVTFTRRFNLLSQPNRALLHFSADTRYKLYVNGVRVAVGPTRSSSSLWYYDTVDVAPHLAVGDNEVTFVVLRYFAASRGAMPFVRTSRPGLTVVGSVEHGIDLGTHAHWVAQIDDGIEFPSGLIDDVFLHIYERVTPTRPPPLTPSLYNIKTVNGELSPWRLRPRPIPMPEETPVAVGTIKACQSVVPVDQWTAFFSRQTSLNLPAASSHLVEVQAATHSTAFLSWALRAAKQSHATLKVTYSEGYEQEPRSYPFFRAKSDRLDAKAGRIIGPYDEATIAVPQGETVVYEPFWFRTFFVFRLEITVGPEPVDLVSFSATQVNYPMAVKAAWNEPTDKYSKGIWDVSIRTMRNCMFDGYSDCPFYEQLQYAGDSRTVALFHYLLSGDDRLMRQAISNFAASVTVDGLTQSRYPSQTPQIIAGFSLIWILQVCDHYLFFGDSSYTKSFLPRIDGILEYFGAHVDDLGLVSGLSEDVWQFVDWVTSWGATEDHPDKGVPTAGRKSNRHTYFSMLYALVLQKTAGLVREVGRPGYADEYESRAVSVVAAIRKHCYDGQSKFFTDTTADAADESAYSQQCQVFAVLCGASDPGDSSRLLKQSFGNRSFSKCSYMMQFYALRAFSAAGDEAYEEYWKQVWDPWRKMLDNNLTTWEEDDVRQRSDCHAWGSVPIYEYCTELAGIRPTGPGCNRILFKPRLHLTETLEAKVALGRDNLATVSWKASSGETRVELRLDKATHVTSRLPGGEEVEQGIVKELVLVYRQI